MGDHETEKQSLNETQKRDFGKLQHGCEHYRRRCKIRAPCCNQIFPCRHCHNDFANSLSDPKDHHELVRQDVQHVICAVCETEQQVAQVCLNCSVIMGEYFCGICKFFDDDTSKQQFHCDQCGICRVGGRDNFFHCVKCGSCYSVSVRDNHSCVEDSMKSQCPVCFEYLFDSIKQPTIMRCGHVIHQDCMNEMAVQNQYRCPICLKTVFDMSRVWHLLDEEIAAVEMPQEYEYKVAILCNDCNRTCEVSFHVLGHKCPHCSSYNTRRISTPDCPSGD